MFSYIELVSFVEFFVLRSLYKNLVAVEQNLRLWDHIFLTKFYTSRSYHLLLFCRLYANDGKFNIVSLSSYERSESPGRSSLNIF